MCHHFWRAVREVGRRGKQGAKGLVPVGGKHRVEVSRGWYLPGVQDGPALGALGVPRRMFPYFAGVGREYRL
eukprot:202936-Lingulodinium_polyedra.AAC.1